MVGLVGLEPMTSTMSTWRSNQLSYNPLRSFIIHIRKKNASLFFAFSIFGGKSHAALFKRRAVCYTGRIEREALSCF